MEPSSKQALANLLAEKERRIAQRAYLRMFPDIGPLCRESYPKQLEFFEAGANYRERCFMAANRVGKTRGAGYECALHLTGLYPGWWPGRRFSKHINMWVAGGSWEDCRDIIQRELLGPPTAQGTGMIPGEHIGRTTRKSGVADMLDTVQVKHASGGWSTLKFKTYEQGRESFQGTAQDVIWLDEECPADVYTECLLRTMTTNGIVMLTFTPLKGLTDVVLQFLPGGKVLQ